MKIVMLPGLDGTGLLFEPALATCPAEFEAIPLALSQDEPSTYADLAERVLRDLPGEEPYLLLAESFSGPLALEVARKIG